MEEIKVYDEDGNQVTMLVQWDLDIYIYIKNDKITTNHNVHFFNSESDVAYVVPSTYEDGILCCKIPNRLLFVALPITGYIYITEDNDSYRSTFVFNILVRSRAIPSDFLYIPDAEDDYISVVKALAWCQDYAETACACAAEAEDWSSISKSWAVGDTGVRAGEDTDNSKYYSQQSSSSATLAESWAVGGTGSRSGEDTNNSKYYAQQASTSASNAKTSETNAAASATSAGESAEKAAQFDPDIYALKKYYDNDSANVGRKSGTSSGNKSFTFGYNCEASGDYSLAEGYNTVASSGTSGSSDSGSGGGDTGDTNPGGSGSGGGDTGDTNPGGSGSGYDYTITKTADKSTYDVGDTITYTITVDEIVGTVGAPIIYDYQPSNISFGSVQSAKIDGKTISGSNFGAFKYNGMVQFICDEDVDENSTMEIVYTCTATSSGTTTNSAQMGSNGKTASCTVTINNSSSSGGGTTSGGTEGSASDENCSVDFRAEKSSYTVGEPVNLTLEVIFTEDCDYFYLKSNYSINILSCTLNGNIWAGYQSSSDELECIYSFSQGDVLQIAFRTSAGSSATQVFQIGFIAGSGNLTYVNATINVTNTLSLHPLASNNDVGCSHSEGNSTTASGTSSHSEGRSTVAYGECSHAEGYNTMADGNYSHAEGAYLSADGNYSHAEGYGSYAGGFTSHSEGYSTGAYRDYSHAEGYLSQAWGNYSHAEGRSTYTYGHASHAEGYSTIADGIYSHAEGDQTTSGEYAHAEGYKTSANGSESHAEGHITNAEGAVSHAEGGYTTASGNYSHAEGYECEANGYESHASGYHSVADGFCSAAFGYYTNAAPSYQVAIGLNNRISSTGTTDGTTPDYFVIGNGDSSGYRHNAFRVTSGGWAYGYGFDANGADYAEFIREWADGNPDEEDRVGYFVTIKDGYLYKADEGDFIVGITSGNPAIVGNADEDYYWQYERDDFGRIVYANVEESIVEESEIEQTSDELASADDVNATDNNTKHKRGIPRDANPEDANPSVSADEPILTRVRVFSEDYDPSLQSTYVERKYRPEWDYVGMVGVIPVRDDGTCKVDEYCKCGGDGIATYAAERGFDTFYVIERVSENVVSVVVK